MNKIFHKGIFYKEWIMGKWFMILFMIEYLFMWIWPYISNSYFDRCRWYKDAEQYFFISDNRIGLIVITLIIVITIMFSDRQKGKLELLSSMPYKREQIIGTKWIVCVMSFLVPIVISFIVMSGIHLINKNSLGNDYNLYVRFKYIVEFLAFNLSVNLCITSFLFFIQTIGGNFLISSVIGSIFIVLPIIIHDVLFSFFWMIGQNENYIYIGRKVQSIFSLDSSIVNLVIVFLIIAIISTILMFYAFKRNDLEKSGCIALYKSYEIILKIGITFFSSIIVTMIATSMMFITIEKNKSAHVFCIVVMVILSIIFYKIVSKIFKYFKN